MKEGERLKVKPIKSKQLEKDYEEELKERDYRVYIFYMLGSRTGFRQGDLLQLRVRDVKDKKTLGITEQKTGEYREVPIPSEVRKLLARYIRDKKENDYLFRSTRKIKKPMDYTSIYKIMKACGEAVGLEQIGTHTMRKTYGYRIFSATGSLGEAQLLLGQSNARDTEEYVGADEDHRAKVTKKVFG